MDGSTPNTVSPIARRSPALSLEELAQSLPGLRRLLVGGAINGAEEMISLLRQWEAELELLRENPGMPLTTSESDNPPRPFQFSEPPAQESDADLLRYALIGWIAETERRLQGRLKRLDRLTRMLHRQLDPWLKPFRESWWTAPLRKRAQQWRERGEDELRRWITLGRAEEMHSRDLARLALKRTVDQNIKYLATNPALEELVETQSTSLADEVVEEVRERTVSADTFLEGVARAMLRRAPRARPPEAPEHVRKRADGVRVMRRPPRRR